MNRHDLAIGQEVYFHPYPGWRTRPRDGERAVVVSTQPYKVFGTYGHREPHPVPTGQGVLVHFPDRPIGKDVGNQVVRLAHLKGEFSVVFTEQAERNKDLIHDRIEAKSKDARLHNQRAAAVRKAVAQGIDARPIDFATGFDDEKVYFVAISGAEFAMMMTLLKGVYKSPEVSVDEWMATLDPIAGDA